MRYELSYVSEKKSEKEASGASGFGARNVEGERLVDFTFRNNAAISNNFLSMKIVRNIHGTDGI